MINGEISIPSIIQTVHFADDQRRDIDPVYYTDGSLRRRSTARYRSRLLYRRFTSPMINGEIPIPSIIQTVHFADGQRRDTDDFYNTDGSLRCCSTARFQSLHYTEAFTSPLYNGEISVSLLYRGIYFAVVQRRDFSLLYIQRHLLRRGTTARFRSVIYNYFTLIYIL